MTQQELSINDKKQICKIVLQRLIQVGLSAPANRCITASISNKKSLFPRIVSLLGQERYLHYYCFSWFTVLYTGLWVSSLVLWHSCDVAIENLTDLCLILSLAKWKLFHIYKPGNSNWYTFVKYSEHRREFGGGTQHTGELFKNVLFCTLLLFVGWACEGGAGPSQASVWGLSSDLGMCETRHRHTC